MGHRKGKDLQENLRCNFGMPNPEGYRKALRLMEGFGGGLGGTQEVCGAARPGPFNAE